MKRHEIVHDGNRIPAIQMGQAFCEGLETAVTVSKYIAQNGERTYQTLRKHTLSPRFLRFTVVLFAFVVLIIARNTGLKYSQIHIFISYYFSHFSPFYL